MFWNADRNSSETVQTSIFNTVIHLCRRHFIRKFGITLVKNKFALHFKYSSYNMLNEKSRNNAYISKSNLGEILDENKEINFSSVALSRVILNENNYA